MYFNFWLNVDMPDNNGDNDEYLDDFYRIIELKTAELFRVSCLVGAFLGGFEKAYCSATATFGLRLGVAYQLFDDLADLFGDERRFGKTSEQISE